MTLLLPAGIVTVSVCVHGPEAPAENMPVAELELSRTSVGTSAAWSTPSVWSSSVSGPAGVPAVIAGGPVAKPIVVGDHVPKVCHASLNDAPANDAAHQLGSQAAVGPASESWIAAASRQSEETSEPRVLRERLSLALGSEWPAHVLSERVPRPLSA